MKITKLELIDYKCFVHLVLEDLGDRVVLVGPNGSGKSAILEAIAVVKEYIGTYDPNVNRYMETIPVLNKHTTAWPQNQPLPIRSDQESATIRVHLQLNEAEAAVVDGQQLVEASICIHRSREVSPTTSHSRVPDLFRHFDPSSGIGVFDYISADRRYSAQRIQSLDITRLSMDSQRRERVELPQEGHQSQKFSAIKHFIISEQLKDLSTFNATGDRTNSIALLQELFAFFFGPKKLVGGMERDSELQVVVDTPYGVHDLDQLSSGEKELFTVFVNLFRIREFPAVILYDEPERHLNPGLEAKVIPALDRLQTQNQLWISTHGTELVGSVPMDQIIALSREGGTAAPARFSDESKAARARLFEDIGARVGLQLSANRIVFLEGKETHADKRILDQLAGKRLPGVLFVASGSALDVQGAATRAGLLIEHASKDAAFLMVLDRDYRDDASVEALIKRLSDRAFVWRCHEVENLLLEPSAILSALQMNGVDLLTTAAEVDAALEAAARGLSERFSAEWAAYRHHAELGSGGPAGPQTAAAFEAMVEARRDRMQEAYAAERTASCFRDAASAVERSLSDGSWRDLLPGKEVLAAFRLQYLPALPGELFIDHIVHFAAQSSEVHPEVQRLCEFISEC